MPKIKVYENEKIMMIKCKFGANLAEVLRLNHLHINAPCGGQGRCEKCTVIVDGCKVLACKYIVKKDVEVRVKSVMLKDFCAQKSKKIIGNIGVVVDIGTTNISAALVDLSNAKILQKIEITNEQSAFGADVLSRILSSRENLEQMSELIKNEISSIKNTFGVDEFTPCVVCGNSVMMHIFANIDPSSLGRFPFEMNEFFGRKIDENYVVRCAASFIGGDVICGILASEMLETAGNSLLVDVGTNTEIVLKSGDKLIAASAPAGPAFEGVGLKNGMNATAGAIKSVQVEGNEITCKTVDDAPVVGICGSGIVDAIATFRHLNFVDENGTICGDKSCLKLENTSITSDDIRQILLAKSAIRAAIDVVLNGRDVQKIYLAGKFGKYLNLQSAVAIGLFPKDFIGKVQIVENAAVMGAAKILRNENLKEKSVEIAKKIEFINLTENENFEKIFIEGLRL